MSKLKNKNSNYIWILKIVIISFIISLLFSFIAETIIPNVNLFAGIFITIIFIFIGVIFDMIGLAVTSADISIFHGF